MRSRPVILLCLLLVLGCRQGTPAPAATGQAVALPAPVTRGGPGLAETLAARRSVRTYGPDGLGLAELSQLLWAATGGVESVTAATRTAPSAGATHPLEFYIVVGKGDLPAGVYRYRHDVHAVVPLRPGDVRAELAAAALDQAWVALAPATVVVAADFGRTTLRYGERGIRYVYLEAGGAAQNICLAAQALGLSAVVVGAFRDDEVRGLLGVAEEVLLLVPVGRRP